MTLRIEIPWLPPKELSPNAGKKQNVNKLNRITIKAHDDVIALVREQQAVGEPLARARVTMTFVVPTRGRRDKGNLIASAKPFLDGLTLAKVIRDDAWEYIDEIYPAVQYEKGVSKTIIEIDSVI